MSEEENQKEEAKKAEGQLKATLRVALEEEAYERLMNVAHVKKERYLEAARRTLMTFKRVGRRITDSEMVLILGSMREDNETKITFHKK
ncbi:hypothetical protein HZC07_06260 [Candidatus Micrarchaeota archaeon]|nr:hypothetical protein [Candidatus Micrarchaeota archaeon]